MNEIDIITLRIEVAKLLKDIDWLRAENKINQDTLRGQAIEYERRLGILNHEAEQLKRMQSTYVPREVHDGDKKILEGRLGQLENFQNRSLGRQSVLTAVVAIGVSVVMKLIFP